MHEQLDLPFPPPQPSFAALVRPVTTPPVAGLVPLEVAKAGDLSALRSSYHANLECMDLPGFCGERLAHFPCLLLEGDGALEAERRMAPDGVIEPVDVSGDSVFGLSACLPRDRPDQLRLDGLEERLDHRVVIAVPAPAH